MFHLYNKSQLIATDQYKSGHYEVVKNYDPVLEDLYRLYNISTNNHEYRVYCDTMTYVKYTIVYLKQHLRIKTSEIGYLLYKLSIDNYNVYNNYCNKSAYKTNVCVIIPKYQYEQLWNSIQFQEDFTFNQISSKSLSNQYKLASYMAGNAFFENELLVLYKKSILRHCQDTIFELVRIVINNAYHIAGVDSYQPIEKCRINPIVNACMDDQLYDLFVNYNYDKLVPKIQRIIQIINENQHSCSWLSLPDSDIINNKSYVQLLTMLQVDSLKKIIDYQLQIREYYWGDIIFSYSEKDIINQMVVFEIFKQYKQKNIDFIKQLAINV